jgi:hypothetical protein
MMGQALFALLLVCFGVSTALGASAGEGVSAFGQLLLWAGVGTTTCLEQLTITTNPSRLTLCRAIL